jgi:hypothetical protein
MLKGVKLHRETEFHIFFDPWQVRDIDWPQKS